MREVKNMEPNIREKINIEEKMREVKNMEPNIREKINIEEKMREIKILNNMVKGTKLGNRELFRDLSKSALVDTTLKKSGKNDY